MKYIFVDLEMNSVENELKKEINVLLYLNMEIFEKGIFN